MRNEHLYSATARGKPFLHVFKTMFKNAYRVVLLDPEIHAFMQEVLANYHNSDELTVMLLTVDSPKSQLLYSHLLTEFPEQATLAGEVNTLLQRVWANTETAICLRYDIADPTREVTQVLASTIHSYGYLIRDQKNCRSKSDVVAILNNNRAIISLLLLDLLPSEDVFEHEQNLSRF